MVNNIFILRPYNGTVIMSRTAIFSRLKVLEERDFYCLIVKADLF